MKINPSHYIALIIGILAITFSAQASLVWDNSGGGSTFTTAGNYVGGVAPVSGVDSVTFDPVAGTSFINSAFTLGNGQSFTTNSGGVAVRLSAGADLTIASGSTIDFVTGGNANIAESGNNAANNAMITIEPNATVQINNYFDAAGWTTTFVADANGVTTVDANTLVLRGSNLVVDLTNYNPANGPVVLYDYNNINLQAASEFSNVTIIGGFPGAVLDTAFDIGGGNLVIAIVPEPATLSLIFSFLFIGLLGHRPKRA